MQIAVACFLYSIKAITIDSICKFIHYEYKNLLKANQDAQIVLAPPEDEDCEHDTDPALHQNE